MRKAHSQRGLGGKDWRYGYKSTLYVYVCVCVRLCLIHTETQTNWDKSPPEEPKTLRKTPGHSATGEINIGIRGT